MKKFLIAAAALGTLGLAACSSDKDADANEGDGETEKTEKADE